MRAYSVCDEICPLLTPCHCVCVCVIELRREMDELEGKMQAVFRTAASELGLEPVKTIRLESSAQLGHFLRVTKKVRRGS